MTTIYTHNGAFGAPAIGTREEFRAALASVWPDWHREADTAQDLAEWISETLDRNLIEASAEQIANGARLPAVVVREDLTRPAAELCASWGAVMNRDPQTGRWYAAAAGGLRILEAGHETREACEEATAARIGRMNARNPAGD